MSETIQPKKPQSIAKNTTYLTSSYIIQKALSFFYFILLANFLTTDDLGKYTFALSFTTIFAVFIDIGLSLVLTRECARDKTKAKTYLSNIFTLKIILSALVYSIVVIAINLLKYPEITKQLVYISGIVMFLDSFSLSNFAVLRGFRNLQIEAKGIIINQIIIVVIGSICVFFGAGIKVLISVFLIGSLFNFFYSLYYLWKREKISITLNLDKTILKTLLKLSAPFAIMGIFTRVYSNIDAVLISKMISDKALGLYTVAYKIPFALQFIPSAFAASLYPAMSKYFVNSKQKLQKSFEKAMFYLLLVAAPMSFGIAALSDKIILQFYDERYLESILVLKVLIFGLIFIFLNFPVGSLLNACNKQTLNTILIGCTMVINIIVNIILIPKLGILGAAIAFLCSHGFMFIAGLIAANKIINYNKMFLLVKTFKTILASLIMYLAVIYLKIYLNVFLTVFVGGIVYCLIIYITKGFTVNDFKEAYFSIRKKDEKDLDHNN